MSRTTITWLQSITFVVLVRVPYFSLGCAWCTTTLRKTCSPLSSFVGGHFIIQLASMNCKKHELAERNFIFAQHCQNNESNPAEKHSPSMKP